MAVTPRKFSSDTTHSSAWVGTELITGIVDIGSGVLRNRKFTIAQIHRLISSAFSALPAAAAGNASQLRRVTNLASGEGVVMSTGTEWIVVGNRVYDLGLFIPGVPATSANPVLQKIVIIRPTTIPANFSGAAGHVDVNPDSQYDIDVQVDTVSIGTISIDSTGGVFAFSTNGGAAQNINAGSVLEFIAPSNSPAEASMENLSITIPVLLRALASA